MSHKIMTSSTEQQKANGWSGLIRETAKICQELNMDDCNEVDISIMSKKMYRRFVMNQCIKKDEERLREAAAGKIKCDRIMKDRFGKKPYMSLQILNSVRQHFYSRLQMQPFAGNYAKDKRFLKSNWMCKCGQEREAESHLLSGSCQVKPSSVLDIWVRDKH